MSWARDLHDDAERRSAEDDAFEGEDRVSQLQMRGQIKGIKNAFLVHLGPGLVSLVYGLESRF